MAESYTVYAHITPAKCDNPLGYKMYIGITSQKPKARWNNGNGYKHNEHFFRAIQKYGWGNIYHHIFIENVDKKTASISEQQLIAYYKTQNPKYGYNISSGGEGGNGVKSWLGKHHTEETRRKMSESQKGRIVTEETKEKLRKANIGKHHTEEARRKMSESRKGKVTTSTAVLCVETGTVFNSLKEAALENKINYVGISNVCRNIRKTAGGYHWEYVKE